jgi:hypothetical protein
MIYLFSLVFLLRGTNLQWHLRRRIVSGPLSHPFPSLTAQKSARHLGQSMEHERIYGKHGNAMEAELP